MVTTLHNGRHGKHMQMRKSKAACICSGAYFVGLPEAALTLMLKTLLFCWCLTGVQRSRSAPLFMSRRRSISIACFKPHSASVI